MKHVRVACTAIAAAVFLTGGVDRNARRLNKEGNRNFADGDFPAASQQYEDAQARAPQSPEIAYNLGNALYRQGNFVAAAEQLRRAAAGGVAVGSQSWYNLGNALFKAENLPEAAAAYRQALALAPGDRDAKINYEKTLEAMRDQQKQPQDSQQQKDQQQKNQQKKDGQQQGDSQQEQQQDQQQQQQQQPGEEGKEQQEQNRGEEEQQQPPQEAGLDSTSLAAGELRPEEAQRILEAMREQEKELQRELAKKMKLRARRTEKDW